MSTQSNGVILSFHVDASGETELAPRAYQESILHYRFSMEWDTINKMSDKEVEAMFLKLTD
ncbi:hypothetical protein TOTORO_02750 [Serratia phage vB_SmaS-Totoro]|nr:hypothetical protein TOTORO_02750 [Serratia phage vB_SmaS-Totoro]